MLSMFKDKKGFSALFAAQATSARTVPILHDRPVRLSAQDIQRLPGQPIDDVLSRTYRCQRCWRTFYVDGTAQRSDFICRRCDYPICVHCRNPLDNTTGAVGWWRCCACAQTMTLMRLFDSTRYGTQLVIRVIEFCDARSERILKSFFHAAAQQLSVGINSPSSSPGRLSSPPAASAVGRLSRRSTMLLQTLPPPPSLQSLVDKENCQVDATSDARKTVAAPSMLDTRTKTETTATADDTAPRHAGTVTGSVADCIENKLRIRAASAQNQVSVDTRHCDTASNDLIGEPHAELSNARLAGCVAEETWAGAAATCVECHDNAAPATNGCGDGGTPLHGEATNMDVMNDDEELRVSASSGRTTTSRPAPSTSVTPTHPRDDSDLIITTTTAATMTLAVALPGRQVPSTSAFTAQPVPTAPAAEHVSSERAFGATMTSGKTVIRETTAEAPTAREASLSGASTAASSSRSASPAPRFPPFSQFLDEQAAVQTRPLLQLLQQPPETTVVQLPSRHGASNSGGGGSHEAGLVTVSPASSSEEAIELNGRRYSGQVALRTSSTTPASSKKKATKGASPPQTTFRTPREASSSRRTRHTTRLTTARRRSESRLTPVVAAAYMLSARRLSGVRAATNNSASATPQAPRQRSGVRLSFGEVSAVAEEGLGGQGSLLRVSASADSAPRQEGSRRRTGLVSARTTARTTTTPPMTPPGKTSNGGGTSVAVRPVRAILTRTIATTTTITRIGHRAVGPTSTAAPATTLTRTASRTGNGNPATRLGRTPSFHGGVGGKTGTTATTPGRLVRTPSSTMMRHPILLHPFGGPGRTPDTTTPRSPLPHSARPPCGATAVGLRSGVATTSPANRGAGRVPALPLSPHGTVTPRTPPSSSLISPATHRDNASTATTQRGGLFSRLFLTRTPSAAAPAVLTRMRSSYTHAGSLYTRTATATPSSLLLRRTHSANAALFGRRHTEVPASLRLGRTRSLNTPLTRPPRCAGVTTTTTTTAAAPRVAAVSGQRVTTRRYTRTSSFTHHPTRPGVTAAPFFVRTPSTTTTTRTPAGDYGGGDTFASRAHMARPPATASPLKRLHTAAALNGVTVTPTALRRVPTSRTYERVPSTLAATARRAELAPTAQRAARTAATPPATSGSKMVVYMTRVRHAATSGTTKVASTGATSAITRQGTRAPTSTVHPQPQAGVVETEGRATAATLTDGVCSESGDRGGGRTSKPTPSSTSSKGSTVTMSSTPRNEAARERDTRRGTPQLVMSGQRAAAHTAETRFAGPVKRFTTPASVHAYSTTSSAGLQRQASLNAPLMQRFVRTDR